jgi:hypothetical protein
MDLEDDHISLAERRWQSIVNEETRASPVRQDRASLAKHGEQQECIDVLSMHRLSLQQKQRFHNQYMHTCLLRATK